MACPKPNPNLASRISRKENADHSHHSTIGQAADHTSCKYQPRCMAHIRCQRLIADGKCWLLHIELLLVTGKQMKSYADSMSTVAYITQAVPPAVYAIQVKCRFSGLDYRSNFAITRETFDARR